MNRPLQAASQPAASPYLDRGTAIAVFLAFAAAYFCSALVRSITATLAPVLTQEFSLQARDLGLLGGGYFLGFAAMQLPLGSWLDRFGPKQVLLCFLSLAVVGCLAFSLATGFAGLLAARVLIGMGVSACMMAALTGYRRWFEAPLLLRANSWMLMTGSLGMLASTLPVQWLMPLLGWRPLFWILAGLIALSMLVIGLTVPAQEPRAPRCKSVVAAAASPSGYRQIWRSGYFRRMSPLAFFNYGGLIAIQTLWAGPWMVRVAGYTPFEAATGLFFINAAMLVTFWAWGLLNPVLAHRGWSADRLVKWGIPLGHSVQLDRSGREHLCRSRCRVARLGDFLCGVKRDGAGPACGRHGLPASAGRACAVGLQPGDFFGRVRGAVGTGAADRPVSRQRLQRRAQFSVCIRRVFGELRCRLCLLSAQPEHGRNVRRR